MFDYPSQIYSGFDGLSEDDDLWLLDHRKAKWTQRAA
jgi:hypothetical protein